MEIKKLIYSIAIALSIEYSSSKSIHANQEQQCESVNFHNNDRYITPQMRYDVCKEFYPSFEFSGESGSKIPVKCLSEGCNLGSLLNPCAVICSLEGSSYDLGLGPMVQMSVVHTPTCDQDCDFYVSVNSRHPFEHRITNTSQQCGDNHFCDDNGCCTERITVTTESIFNDDTQTTVSSTPKKTETVETPSNDKTDDLIKPSNNSYQCHKVGLFSDITDGSHRKFYDCQLVAIRLECPTGQIFDHTTRKCAQIRPTTKGMAAVSEPSIPVTTIDWTMYLPVSICKSEGHFRNPYHCNKYYRCFRNDETDIMRIEYQNCYDNLVMDENKEECVYAEDTKSCSARQLPTLNLDCPSGLVFDEYLVKCIPQDSTTLAAINTEPPGPVNVADWSVYLPISTCKSEGRFRNPYNCHKYYWCYNDGTNVLAIVYMDCAANLVLDEDIQDCVYRADTKPCQEKHLPGNGDIKSTPLAVVPETSLTVEELRKLIQCHRVGYFRDPYDCSQYYQCYYSGDSMSIVFNKCPTGLGFDESATACVALDNYDQCANKVN